MRSFHVSIVIVAAALTAAACVSADEFSSDELAAMAKPPGNTCEKFPPDATGDGNAQECTPAAGEQTMYCHVHTAGDPKEGCADLPKGPKPQLHCLLPGQAEGDAKNIDPAYGGELGTAFCEKVEERRKMRGADKPAKPSCNEDHDGIEVKLTFPDDPAKCTCCTAPLTGKDPNLDCSKKESECAKFYFGEGCGVPDLSLEANQAAAEILCAGLAAAAADTADATLSCMRKPCKYQDNQYCWDDKTEKYIPCKDLDDNPDAGTDEPDASVGDAGVVDAATGGDAGMSWPGDGGTSPSPSPTPTPTPSPTPTPTPTPTPSPTPTPTPTPSTTPLPTPF